MSCYEQRPDKASDGGADFGTEMKKPLNDESVREIVLNAHDLSLNDDRVVVKDHLEGLPNEGQLAFLEDEGMLDSLLFMAETQFSSYTPTEERGEDFEQGVVEVFLELRPLTLVGVGDVYVTFDIKADPETCEIRYMGVHASFTGETKRRLIQEDHIDW